MLEVRPFVNTDQVDDAGPQPGRRVERARCRAFQLSLPIPTLPVVQLTRVGQPEDPGQRARRSARFGVIEHGEFQLQILWHQLTYEHGATEHGAG